MWFYLSSCRQTRRCIWKTRMNVCFHLLYVEVLVCVLDMFVLHPFRCYSTDLCTLFWKCDAKILVCITDVQSCSCLTAVLPWNKLLIQKQKTCIKHVERFVVHMLVFWLEVSYLVGVCCSLGFSLSRPAICCGWNTGTWLAFPH